MTKEDFETISERAKLIAKHFLKLHVTAAKCFEFPFLKERIIWCSWFNLLSSPLIYKDKLVLGWDVYCDVLDLDPSDLSQHPLLNLNKYQSLKDKLEVFFSTKVINPFGSAEFTIKEGLETYIGLGSFAKRHFKTSKQKDYKKYIEEDFNIRLIFLKS